MNEYQVRFLERIQRTPASISYRFTKPEGLTFTAGQYMLVNLGDKLVHPLSLSDCPEETGFIEFTKRMTGSPYCQKLESFKPGQTITVKGPNGSFSCDDSDDVIIMIAGGIGITPIRSILKSHEIKSDTQSRKVVLIYGNLNVTDIAFKEELEQLQLSDFRIVHVLSDTSGMDDAYQGFITADILSKEIPATKRAIYLVSGPPAMVEAIKTALAAINISEDQIRTDQFFRY